jgi:hypothetical protein
MKLKKILQLWNYWANLNQTLLKWSLGSPLSKFVRQRRPVSKMATITKNRNFFKWPKLLYFKPRKCPNLNCISIMMSFLTYITGFFMNFELLPILTDYAN